MQRLILPGLFFCAAMCPTPSIGAPERDASSTIQPAASAVTQPTTVLGTVTSAEARWNDRGDRIFTHVVIALADGSTMTVRQPGGTVGDIGMVQFPSPPLLRQGDQIEARVARLGNAWSVMDVTSLARPRSDAPAPDDAPGAEALLAPESRAITGTGDGDGEPPRLEYVRTTTDAGAPLYWGSSCVYITFDAAGTTHLPDELEFTIMEQQLDHWRQSITSCSYMDFVIEPRAAATEEGPPEVGFDGVNLIKFREDTWCRPAADGGEECYAPEAAGLTTLTFINNPESDRYGEILDTDIELNAAVQFSISADGVTSGPAERCLSDLSNTFTHEVGHLLGLDHTCRFSGEPARLDGEGNEVPLCGFDLPPEILEATMHPSQLCGEIKKATLETDDIAAACAVYAQAVDPGVCKPADLTTRRRRWCMIAPAGSAETSPPAALALLLGAALVLWRLRRRADS